MTEKENRILTYVAQNIIGPLFFDERTPKEIWEEYSSKQFNELTSIICEKEK